jgi:hypothetical protein
MTREVYRYVFNPQLSVAEVLATLDLALIAVESLHGEARARMDARFVGRPFTRTLVIDASTHVGQALNQVFVGYARREFGKGAFAVARCPARPTPSPKEAACPSAA